MALKIAAVTGVSPAWLLAGQGDISDNPENFLEPVSDVKVPMVPVFESMAAISDPSALGGRILYYLPRPHGIDVAPLYGFEVVGDCMYPAYKPGDVVFAMPESINNIRSGEDVVALLEWNEFTLKRWNPISEERIELISLNRTYRPLEIQRSAVRSVARVVALQWADAVRRCMVEPGEVEE